MVGKKEEEEACERLPHVVSRARRTPHFGRMKNVVKDQEEIPKKKTP